MLEFITGLGVSLSWGGTTTGVLDRGEFGVPQGSLEGMWNFSVYTDNIQREIIKAVPGILVGGQVVRDVVYADDITPITSCPSHTNMALSAIASQGDYNGYKFKPSKCKVIGADPRDYTEYKLGSAPIPRASHGTLLGTEINETGINTFEHVRSRQDMVRKQIS